MISISGGSTMMSLFQRFVESGLLHRFWVLVLGLIAFRVITAAPIPYLDRELVQSLLAEGAGLFSILDIFSGGGLSNVSIGLLGVFPYITVAIIVQLLTVAVPRIHALYHEEGEVGRKKLSQWTRIATVPVAALNAVGLLLLLQSQNLLGEVSLYNFIASVALVTVGSIILMWFGELITEYGIGNGISFIIFASIVLNLPTLISQLDLTLEPATLLIAAGYIVGVFILTIFAVWVNEAERPIPITHSRFGGERSTTETYLPVKVNPAGVLPVIFALTLIVALSYGIQYLASSGTGVLQSVGDTLSVWLQQPLIYSIPVSLLTFFFVYFHSPIVFNSEKVAKSLERQGAYIPGIRPGDDTEVYIGTVLRRIIFYAAVFLCIISAAPFIVTGSVTSTFGLSVGGTGLLIAVSVVLDIYKKTSVRMLG